MASENETVTEAIASERDHIEKVKADAEELEIECEFTVEEVVAIIDRFEAAWQREKETSRIAARSAQARFDEALKERDVAIAELRECLNEAIAGIVGPCRSRWPCALCSKDCKVKRWRKALEGGES